MNRYLLLFLLPYMSFAAEVTTEKRGFCSVIDTLKTYTEPTLYILAFIFVIAGIVFAGIEFTRKSLGWAIGGILFGLLISAILFALGKGSTPLFTKLGSALGCF